jgi:hypothetical protein
MSRDLPRRQEISHKRGSPPDAKTGNKCQCESPSESLDNSIQIGTRLSTKIVTLLGRRILPAVSKHLDEMHGPESLPYRGNRALPKKPDLDDIKPSGSKIFQPTDSRQSGPEFGPSPRSTGGAPGHRGGWKKR